MADIAKVRGTNGLKVVSTFSGCGGSCLGFEMAGYEIAYAVEFVPAARDVYRQNHPGVYVDERDIRKIQADDILNHLGIKRGELDVLEGSPPCASFSTSGKREKAWGEVKKYSDTKQRTDDLFFEFARLLEGLQPRAFVAENVGGLVRGMAWGYFEQIIEALSACGYRVVARLLDAQWLGVPQTRSRLIFIGVRNDIGLDPVHPVPLPYRYSIRDALPWVDRVRWDAGGTYRAIDRDGTEPVSTITATSNHQFMVFDGKGSQREGEMRSLDLPSPVIMADGIGGVAIHQCHVVAPEAESVDIARYAIGKEWKKLKYGQGSRKYLNLIRTDPSKPCGTITAEGGNVGAATVTHPYEPRKFTIPELKRLCAFPDDFELTGSFRQQWERLGRSVPPVMMFHVARAVREGVFRKLGRVSAGAHDASSEDARPSRRHRRRQKK